MRRVISPGLFTVVGVILLSASIDVRRAVVACRR